MIDVREQVQPVKSRVEDLACFGGKPLFDTVKPTSNLVQPDRRRFYAYARRWLNGNHDLVSVLEHRLADLHGVPHCISACSGFWGLALCIDALRRGRKLEVVIPSLGYRRMADIVAWVGLIPRFCDVEIHTLASSAMTVRPCLNPRTALIVGAHPVGGHCDIDGLSTLARENGIPLIFDSVECVAETHAGKRIGTFGDAELFSLGASKLINGFEGGYITTGDARLATRLRKMIRGHPGRAGGRYMTAPLQDVHAAMGLAALEDLPAQLRRNKERFLAYCRNLADITGLRLAAPDPATEPSYKNIVVEVLSGWPITRDETVSILNQERILARAYYSPPLTRSPMRYAHVARVLPNTDYVAARYISMPCGHLVTVADIDAIAATLRFIAEEGVAIKRRFAADRL